MGTDSQPGVSNAGPQGLGDLLAQGLVSQMPIPEIVVFLGKAEITRRLLDRSPINIGRHPVNELVLEDRAVSRKHAVITQEAGQWWIRDAGSRHKLKIGEKECDAHAFQDGDRVILGPYELVFHASVSMDISSATLAAQPRRAVPSDQLDARNPNAFAPAVEIPGYEIVREIGRGGMGRVYEAIQLSTRRTVALKVMLEGPYTTEKAKKRFEREVRIVAALRHPNIAQVYESGLHQGRYWFAMEYVDGQPLDATAEASNYSLGQRLSIMAAVCDAVGYAHEHRVVHRDLKPSNILVSTDGQPHILDFGLAKIEDPARDHEITLSMQGELMGTPAYMSPEQTERDPSKLDARTDVYSLGVILYRLTTGQFPYEVIGRLDEVIRRIAMEDPQPPNGISTDIDDELQAIILKTLAKDPAERYDNARAMADDLRRRLAGEPVEAKLHSRSYLMAKAFRKHRTKLMAAACAVATILITAFITWAIVKPSINQATVSVVSRVDNPGGDATKKTQVHDAIPDRKSDPKRDSSATIVGKPRERKRILFFSATDAYPHAVIGRVVPNLLSPAEQAFSQFATLAGYEVTCSQDPSDLAAEEQLYRYDAIVLYITGDPPINRAAMLQWLYSGKALIGVHSSTAAFTNWPEYKHVMGAVAGDHGASDAKMVVKAEDVNHPAAAMMQSGWLTMDEIFQFTDLDRSQVHVLLSVDTEAMSDRELRLHKMKKGGDYPIAWTNTYGQGRIFYTALGHREDVWTNPVFQKHLLSGVAWALHKDSNDDGRPLSIVYVKPTATGKQDGSSWSNAFANLQQALNAAKSGQELWVAAGTYKPAGRNGDRQATFQLKNGVAIYGGFSGMETARDQRDIVKNLTTLSGDLNGDDGTKFTNNSDNCYHVVNGSGTDPSAVLNGLTVTGGNADGPSPNNSGGGLVVLQGNPAVTDCTFVRNRAAYSAGMISDGSNMVLEHCVFRDNESSNGPGGMTNHNSQPTLKRCAFLGNSGKYGGGMMNWSSAPTLIECSFHRNTAREVGGGGLFNNNSSPMLIRCVFSENSARWGGGMDSFGNSNPTVINCVFNRNTVQDDGGGVIVNDRSQPSFVNCIFVGNIAGVNGGGCGVWDDSHPILFNCVFRANKASTGGGVYCKPASRATIANCILWDNRESAPLKESAQIVAPAIEVSHSCVQYGWKGLSNLSLDPLFVNADGHDGRAGTEDDDLRLRPGSPCIDAGDAKILPPDVADLNGNGNTDEPMPIDLDGRPRVVGQKVDIGAYEHN